MEKIIIELIPEKDINFIEHWCVNPKCDKSKLNKTGVSVLIPTYQYTGKLLFCSSCKKILESLPYRSAYIEYMLNRNKK